MSNLKTKPETADAMAFLQAVEPEARRDDALRLAELMQQITGAPPVMWGKSIVGFGSYHYVYESGREGDWFLCGFSPRKAQFSLYLMDGFEGRDDLLSKLGRHKTGKSCLYVRKLADIDEGVLRALIEDSVASLRAAHPETGA